MSIKPFALMMILAALIIPAEAKKKKGGGKGNQKQAEKARKQEAAEKAEKDRTRAAVNEFLAQKDTSKDRIVTKEEYLADESDKEAAGKKFDQYNKNKDRALSRTEIEALLGL